MLSSWPTSAFVWRALGLSVLSGVLGQALLLLSGILTARILGVEGRGYFAVFGALAILSAQLSEGGIGSAIAYALSNRRSTFFVSRGLTYRITACQAALGSLLFFGIALIYERASGWATSHLAVWGICAVVGTALFRNSLAVSQGLQQFRLLNCLRLLPLSLFGFVLLYFFITRNADTTWVVAAWGATTLFGGLATFIIATRNPGLSDTHTSARDTASLIRYGARSFIGTTGPLETFRLDQLAVGASLSAAMAGLYSVGASFSQLPRIVAQSGGYVALPLAAVSIDEQRRAHLIRLLLKFSMGIVALCAALWVVAPLLVPMLFGDPFADAIQITRILMLGAGVSAVRKVVVDVAIGLAWPQVATYSELLGLLAFGLLILTCGIPDIAMCAWFMVLAQAAALILAISLISWSLQRSKSH